MIQLSSERDRMDVLWMYCSDVVCAWVCINCFPQMSLGVNLSLWDKVEEQSCGSEILFPETEDWWCANFGDSSRVQHHVWVRGRDRRVFTGVERLHTQERFQERGEEINRECFTQEWWWLVMAGDVPFPSCLLRPWEPTIFFVTDLQALQLLAPICIGRSHEP